jgi:hypothetical protein
MTLCPIRLAMDGVIPPCVAVVLWLDRRRCNGLPPTCRLPLDL